MMDLKLIVRDDKNGFPIRFLPLPSALSRINAIQLGSCATA